MKTLLFTHRLSSRYYGAIEIILAVLLCYQSALANGNKASNPSPQIKVDVTVTNVEKNGVMKIKYAVGDANVQLIDSKTKRIQSFSTDAQGNTVILISPNSSYEAVISKDGFQTRTIKISVGDITESADYREEIELKLTEASTQLAKK